MNKDGSPSTCFGLEWVETDGRVVLNGVRTPWPIYEGRVVDEEQYRRWCEVFSGEGVAGG